MSKLNKIKLLEHIGHDISIVTYVDRLLNIVNVSLECHHCNEVLADYDVTEKDVKKVLYE